MDTQTNKLTTIVLATVQKVLKPLVRLMLTHNITLPAIIEVLKKVYIEVAEEDFSLSNKKTTDSRISIITGVHRKDVKRLRGEEQQILSPPKSISLGSKVVNTWLTDKRWLNKDKTPKILKRSSDNPKQLSFNKLSEQVSKDVRARAILDELVRIGIVTLLEDDKVKLCTEAFIPTNGLEEKLYYFEQSTHDHLMAATKNIQGHKPPFLERIVHYENIPIKDLPELRKTIDTAANTSLRKINEKAKKLSDKSSSTSHKITYGVYFYDEENLTNSDKS